MSSIEFTGLTSITLDGEAHLSVSVEPLSEIAGCSRVTLSPNQILGNPALVLSAYDSATVYEATKGVKHLKGVKYLFIVRGHWDQETIQLLSDGPDEEKSEMVLKRVCHLGLY